MFQVVSRCVTQHNRLTLIIHPGKLGFISQLEFIICTTQTQNTISIAFISYLDTYRYIKMTIRRQR